MATLFIGKNGAYKPSDLGLSEDENGSWDCVADSLEKIEAAERKLAGTHLRTLDRRIMSNGDYDYLDDDDFDMICPGSTTVETIASKAQDTGVLVALCCGDGTQYDMFFKTVEDATGGHHMGARKGDLLVGVLGFRTFCFDVDTSPLSEAYVAEKLGIHSKVIAQLLTDIRIKIHNERVKA